MDAGVLERLMEYSWPGNVRELENAVERACALCDNCRIQAGHLPATVLSLKGPDGVSSPAVPLVGFGTGRSLSAFLEHIETRYINDTIAACQGSREKAAKLLQISLATLYRKLEAGKRSSGSDGSVALGGFSKGVQVAPPKGAIAARVSPVRPVLPRGKGAKTRGQAGVRAAEMPKSGPKGGVAGNGSGRKLVSKRASPKRAVRKPNSSRR